VKGQDFAIPRLLKIFCYNLNETIKIAERKIKYIAQILVGYENRGSPDKNVALSAGTRRIRVLLPGKRKAVTNCTRDWTESQNRSTNLG